MSHPTSNLKSIVLASFACYLLSGCVHETWSFRAVPNVNVARPNELGSQGSLVLVVDGSSAGSSSADSLNDMQLGMSDPGMKQKIERKQLADEAFRKWQTNLGDQHPRVIEARLTLAEATQDLDDYRRQYREMQKTHPSLAESAKPDAKQESKASPQTVLVVAMQHDFGKYDNSIGRSVVLFLDGPPAPGQYWMTADNSVLITYSAWSAPARSRVALSGSVKIISATNKQIVADVAFRETTEADSTEWVAHLHDPVYWQAPWVVTRRCTFQIASTDDPAFEKAAVRWVAK